MSTSDHNSVERTEQPTDSIKRTYWAAYVLGRHPACVRLWQQALSNCAEANPSCPWGLPWPFDGPEESPDQIPRELEEFDNALRELALADSVKPAVLTELHRAWDRLAGACTQITEMIAMDDRDEVVEIFWSSRLDWGSVQQLAETLLVPLPNLPEWYRFGRDVGRTYISHNDSSLLSTYFPTEDYAYLLKSACASLCDEWIRVRAAGVELQGIEQSWRDRGRLVTLGGEEPSLETAGEAMQMSGDANPLWYLDNMQGRLAKGLTAFDLKLREMLYV